MKHLVMPLLFAAIALSVLMFDLANPSAAEPGTKEDLKQALPVEELTAQTKAYLDALPAQVASEDSYNEARRQLQKDAHTLAVLVLVLDHADHGTLKGNPAKLLAGAQHLAAAKELPAAQAAAKELAAATGESGDGTPLELKGVASLEILMKQVTMVDGRVRRNLKRLDSRSADVARDAAVLAAIAEGISHDREYVKGDAKIVSWEQHCREMRDAATELSRAAKAKQQEAATGASLRLKHSCDSCHKTFRVEPKAGQ